MKLHWLAVFSLALTAQSQQPVFQSETKLVLVDTVVTAKKDEFVRDLTAKDFRVFEDNKERPIRSFSLEATENRSEPRRFIFFFDSSNTSIQDQTAAREAAANFVDANSGSNQLVAAVMFDGLFHVVQPFTDNPARLKQALAAMRLNGANATDARTQDPNQLALAQASSRGLLQMIENLAGNLNALSGRKTLILFTAGTIFNTSQNANIPEIVKVCNRSNVAVYPIIATSTPLSAPNQFDCDQRRPGVIAKGQPSACAPADTAVSDALAKGTGGFMSSIGSDVTSQLKRIGGEESEHYVIGFEPADSNSKGEGCHDLRVKVDRSGVSLRTRSSYCAEKPQDILAQSKVERDLEQHAAASSSGPAIEIEAPFFYPAANVARVHVAAQIPANLLRFETAKGRVHLEMNLLGIVSAADGTVAARFSDIVKRDYESKPPFIDYRKEFKVVPGQYKLTLTFNAGGTDFGKTETPLAIDPFDHAHVAISGIALGSAVHPAENIGLDALSGDGTPLIAGGMQIVQSASERLERNKPTFCYFEIYTPRAAEGAIARVRILDTAGSEKWSAGEGKVSAANATAGVIPVGLTLPVAGLAPGKYRIEATARDGSGATVSRTLDVAVQ